MQRTHCERGHELTPENLYLHSSGKRHMCRECQRIRMRINYAKRKGITLSWEEAVKRGRKPKPKPKPRPEFEPAADNSVHSLLRPYRRQHAEDLERDQAPTPDLLEVMAHGGHCHPVGHGSNLLSAFSADLECKHGAVPGEGCEHGCW